MKILVATEKPFAKAAVDGIRKIVEDAGYELALLEKYTDKADEPKLTWVYHPAGRVSKEKKAARFDEIVKDI